MLAMTMAVAALAVDMVLPAFAAIREDFGLPADSTTPAQIITAFLLGMASAQAAYGPLADRFGRKPVLYAGFSIYAIGASGVAVAPTIPLVLASRFVWGKNPTPSGSTSFMAPFQGHWIFLPNLHRQSRPLCGSQGQPESRCLP